jgi:hypothetical protein
MKRSAFHAMSAALLPLVALVALGCGRTEITIENAIPGATIQGVRWVPSSGTSYTFGEALGPGATSSEVSVSDHDQGHGGVIHFELVMDGRKVALVTDDSFVATANDTTNFRLDPSTAARNPIATSPTDPNPRPAEPTR